MGYKMRFLEQSQNKGNLPLGMEKPPDVGNELGQVLCDERLGGLLKHYHRKAA